MLDCTDSVMCRLVWQMVSSQCTVILCPLKWHTYHLHRFGAVRAFGLSEPRPTKPRLHLIALSSKLMNHSHKGVHGASFFAHGMDTGANICQADTAYGYRFQDDSSRESLVSECLAGNLVDQLKVGSFPCPVSPLLCVCSSISYLASQHRMYCICC